MRALAGRYDNPLCRNGPPGYIGWQNRLLIIDSWAPKTFTNSGFERLRREEETNDYIWRSLLWSAECQKPQAGDLLNARQEHNSDRCSEWRVLVSIRSSSKLQVISLCGLQNAKLNCCRGLQDARLNCCPGLQNASYLRVFLVFLENSRHSLLLLLFEFLKIEHN
jgi:hypothetical protein